MMIRCVGSGSSGNSYAIIDNDNKILLLDLGLPIMEIKRAIDFRISDVVGAVVTHHHKDHSLAVSDFEKMGIPVFTPYKSLEPMDFNGWQGNYYLSPKSTLKSKSVMIKRITRCRRNSLRSLRN